MDATSAVFWPTGELTGTSCKVDSAEGDGVLETSAADKRRETSSATRVIRLSINCGDNIGCAGPFEWVGPAGSDVTAIASTCVDRCVLAGTASTAALLAWTLARGLLRFAGAVEIAVRRVDLAFGMMTICNPKTKRKGNPAYGKTNLKLEEQKGKAGKKLFKTTWRAQNHVKTQSRRVG